MALADRRTQPDTRSKFEKWLDSLSPKNHDVVMSWLLDTTIANAKIVEWIREDDAEDDFIGYSAHSDTVATWRRKNGAR